MFVRAVCDSEWEEGLSLGSCSVLMDAFRVCFLVDFRVKHVRIISLSYLAQPERRFKKSLIPSRVYHVFVTVKGSFEVKKWRQRKLERQMKCAIFLKSMPFSLQNTHREA